MSCAIICPTRGRPANAVRLARACAQTINHAFSTLYFVIDGDDPARDTYLADLNAAAPWAGRLVVPDAEQVHRLGPVLNWAAAKLAPHYAHLAFLGDDHLPRTPVWDERLCWSLDGRPGVAYGDDLLQRQNLPTAAVISSDIVRVLGYMAPPPLAHLFLDDFWKLLGQTAGNLQYLPDVVIEHLHPVAAKAPMDQGYAESGLNAELLRDDGWRYQQWRELAWPADAARLKEALA